MRRVFIGAAAGFVAGYVAVRALQARGDLRSPGATLQRDPRRYGALRRRLMLAAIARSVAGLGAVAYGPPGAMLAPRAGEREPRPRRVALLAAGLIGSALVDAPVDYVEGHVVERRFGLSTQSAGEWALDQLKSTAVATAISLPLLEALATAIGKAPRTWPALATAATLPLLVGANVVAPNLIAPLFNRFEPLDGPLETRVRALAARFGAGDAAIFRVDMSRRTQKANAYVTGLFGSKRIVIGDTLLAGFTPEETLFVVAHELGHYVAKDVWRGVAAGLAGAAFIFFGAAALAGRGGVPPDSSVGLGRTLFVATLLALGAGPPLAALSRSRERAADRFALAATADAAAGASAFRRLRDNNLAEDEQPRWMEVLFSTHPSLKSRIARLEARV